MHEASLGLELYTGRSIGFFHQAWVIFWKRFTILHRNYVPYTAALLPPVLAARGVTLFLNDFSASVRAPAQQISLSDVETLFAQPRYNLLVGPSSSVSSATLTSLYEPILPTTAPQSLIQRYLQTVDTLSDFRLYDSSVFQRFMCHYLRCLLICLASCWIYVHRIYAVWTTTSILLAYVVSLFATTQLCAYAFVAAGQAVMILTYLIGHLCTPRTR